MTWDVFSLRRHDSKKEIASKSFLGLEDGEISHKRLAKGDKSGFRIVAETWCEEEPAVGDNAFISKERRSIETDEGAIALSFPFEPKPYSFTTKTGGETGEGGGI